MTRLPRGKLIAAGSVLGFVTALVLPSGPAIADSTRAGQWHLGFLDVARAHQYSQGAGVTVGLIDAGVDATHPDLVDTVLPGAATFAGATGDGRIDTDGHGTRMAGLIAGHGHGPYGSLGALGIAPKATILSVRVGTGGFDHSGIISGIEWATEHGATVISISIAGPFDDDRQRRVIEDAIAHDIVVVAGVGNAPSTSVGYPAAYPGVLAVAGVDESGNHGAFSVSGPGVMLAAPGANILSTGLNHGYGYATGTSDSTAIVAGAAALVRARFPKLSAVEVIHRLTATAIDKGPPGRDNLYGYGIVNLVGALTADVPPGSSSPSPVATDSASPGAEHGKVSAARTWLIIGLGVLAAVIAMSLAFAYRRRSRG
jgi:type VII secretion-associated serine protease mycosin